MAQVSGLVKDELSEPEVANVRGEEATAQGETMFLQRLLLILLHAVLLVGAGWCRNLLNPQGLRENGTRWQAMLITHHGASAALGRVPWILSIGALIRKTSKENILQ